MKIVIEIEMVEDEAQMLRNDPSMKEEAIDMIFDRFAVDRHSPENNITVRFED